MRTANEVVFDAVTASGTQNSAAISMQNNQLVSWSGVATSNANCTVKLQFSNDAPSTAPASVTNWVDVPNSSATVTSTAGGTISLLMSVQWIRATSTLNSGAGTLSVRINTSGWH